MCETKHKHYECILAWASGKKIQVRHGDIWADIEQPQWYHYRAYRIKPEPKPDIIRYSGLTVWSIPDASTFQRLTDTVEYTFDGETGKLKSVKKV